MKKLREAVAGELLFVREAFRIAVHKRTSILKVSKVNRVNLVTEDGRQWNRDSGIQPGHENLGGSIAQAEPWDADVHPFLEEFEIAQKLLTQLNDLRQYRYRDRAKKFAAALPYLRLAAKELGLVGEV